MPGKLPLRDAPTFAFRRSRKGTIGSHGNRISCSPEKRAVRMVIAISGIENPAARAEALIGEGMEIAKPDEFVAALTEVLSK